MRRAGRGRPAARIGVLPDGPPGAAREPHAMDTVAIELWWLPLGAGGHVVRRCGRAYEALAARRGRRPPRDLYHAALEVRVDGARWTIEVAPAWSGGDGPRGVVAGGAVGCRPLGRLRLFRYEVRRWREGTIPDLAEAVGGAHRLSGDRGTACRLLDLVASVPTPVWGRDELRAGEMWNSNSVAAWLLARAGLPAGSVRPPAGGRAPGWEAGVAVAYRGSSSVSRSERPAA